MALFIRHLAQFLSVTMLVISAAAAAAKSLQLCLTLSDPMDCSHQAPPSMGFSRQEYWSGVCWLSLVWFNFPQHEGSLYV